MAVPSRPVLRVDDDGADRLTGLRMGHADDRGPGDRQALLAQVLVTRHPASLCPTLSAEGTLPLYGPLGKADTGLVV